MIVDLSPSQCLAYKRINLMSAALGVTLPRFRIRGSKYHPHVGKKQLAKAATKGTK